MAGWEQEWIDIAKELVHNAFEQSYKQEDTQDEGKLTLAMLNPGTKVWANGLKLNPV